MKNAQKDQEEEEQSIQRKYYIRESLQEGSLISAMGIRQAIEVFRNKKFQNVYYANSEAGTILENWSTTHGWARAAQIFGSHEVIHNRSDGTYFLPIFVGPITCGPWIVIIIHKRGRYRKGYILDTLGATTTTDQIATKIEMLFGRRNTRFSWEIVVTWPQTELECGPRTLLGIYTAATSLAAGNSIDESIASASMISTRQEDYDSNLVRVKIAELMGQYENSMWTQPIRITAAEAHSRPNSLPFPFSFFF